MTHASHGAAAAWAARAGDLAPWTQNRLVNRTDAWGGYRPPEEWDREYRRSDGTLGKLGRTTTRKGELTLATLERHCRARDRSAVIGLHSTSSTNASLWGALDIDWHGPTSTAPDVNLAAALAWHRWLTERGFRSLLADSNGQGGYHLWLLLREPVPTPRVYHFLRRLVSDHARHGMTAPPETFPKQPCLAGNLRYGNWLGVPGRHHTRDHWSRFWDGSRWLEDNEAIDFILALTGDDPALLPEVPVIPPPAPRPTAAAAATGAAPAHGCFTVRTGQGGNLSARIAAYMSRLPNLGEGQGRDDVAYGFACWLTRDLALADDLALGWLERWDGGNAPPKGRQALAEILANARRYGHQAVGCGLTRTAPGRTPSRRSHNHHVTLTCRVEIR